MASRVGIVKSVVVFRFIHTIMIYRWPFDLLKTMNVAIHNFIWTGPISQHKLVSISWDICCSPSKDGGV